jgi:hypothetical protein
MAARKGASWACPLLPRPTLALASSFLACLPGSYPPRSSQPLRGFTNAQPTWGALEDCWQQLAVVKNGPELAFFRNGQPAGGAALSLWQAALCTNCLACTS